eukprot:2874436-Rhodomonas_salina.2
MGAPRCGHADEGWRVQTRFGMLDKKAANKAQGKQVARQETLLRNSCSTHTTCLGHAGLLKYSGIFTPLRSRSHTQRSLPLVLEEEVLDPRLLAHRLHHARRNHLGQRLGRGLAPSRRLPRPERHEDHTHRRARRRADDDGAAARGPV